MQDLSDYSVSLQKWVSSMIISDLQGNLVNIQDGCTRAVEELLSTKNTGKKVMIIGNGGSAAIASHLQNDLSKGSDVRAMVFTEQPLLTALSNDICYAAAYPELVRLWAEQGDILLSISSSGRSENILHSSRIARDKGCRILTLSGFSPENPLRKIGDLNFYIPSDRYGYVEVAHTIIAHYLSDCLLDVVSGKKGSHEDRC
jgi:D-sedoheptulose 7-phosphate isomerase